MEGQTFDSNGVKVCYYEAGPTGTGLGSPVILLHGFSSTAHTAWIDEGLMAELARSHRVFAMDGRGHGGSDKPHDAALFGPEAARDTTRLMDHLGLKQAHVVGYSHGAHLAAYLATVAPERFKSLTLGGACGYWHWTDADTTRTEAEAVELDEGSQRSLILRLWPTDQPKPGDEEVARLSRMRLRGSDHHALAGSRRGTLKITFKPEQLAATTMPVLGAVGTVDPYLKDFERLHEVRPRMKLVTIPGASHGEARSRPEFLAALKAFLAEVDGAQ